MQSKASYVGMTLFFVLSGFIIHYNYANTVSQPGGLWRFFVARSAAFIRCTHCYCSSTSFYFICRELENAG